MVSLTIRYNGNGILGGSSLNGRLVVIQSTHTNPTARTLFDLRSLRVQPSPSHLAAVKHSIATI
jgi:hypothetical protein